MQAIHRPKGVIPGCRSAGPVTCPPFDEAAYWTSVQAFVRSVQDYLRHMAEVRAGRITDLAA